MTLKTRLSYIRMRLGAERAVRRAFKDEPILVHQMGKVGSKTVTTMLEKAGLGERTLHMHFLGGDLREKTKRHLEAGIYPGHLARSQAARRRLKGCKRCKVITLVRDPVARAVSMVFQVPQLLGADVKDDKGTFLPEKVAAYLEDKLSSTRWSDGAWFNEELLSVFGIDVFAVPFDKEKGYQTYKLNGTEVLLIRLEDLSRVGPSVLAEFTGLPRPIPLHQANVTLNKEGLSASFQTVKEQLRLSPEVCERVYAGRLARHFYSEEMIEAFKKKWSA